MGMKEEGGGGVRGCNVCACTSVVHHFNTILHCGFVVAVVDNVTTSLHSVLYSSSQKRL